MVTQDKITYYKNSGRMARNLIYVGTHVFDIPERVRDIDPGFFIMFNPGTQKYEVHHEEHDYTLALNLPYSELDSRAVTRLKGSLIEHAKRIKREIKEHNARLEKEKNDRYKDETRYRLGEIHKYCSSHESIDVPDDGAFKTRFV